MPSGLLNVHLIQDFQIAGLKFMPSAGISGNFTVSLYSVMELDDSITMAGLLAIILTYRKSSWLDL